MSPVEIVLIVLAVLVGLFLLRVFAGLALFVVAVLVQDHQRKALRRRRR